MTLLEARDVIFGAVGAALGAGLTALGGMTLGRPARRLARRGEGVLGGLDVARLIEPDPGKMPPGDMNYPVTFYFEGDFTPDEPPPSPVDWWRWAHDRGGHDVGITKVLITLQGVEDVALVVGAPVVRSTAGPVPAGVTCTPEGVGGGGVAPRRYRVQLDANGGPRVEYEDRANRPPQFALSKGETEQIEVEAHTDSGRHEWTASLPITINGVTWDLAVDFGGSPFVTVGGPLDHCRSRLWVDGEWA